MFRVLTESALLDFPSEGTQFVRPELVQTDLQYVKVWNDLKDEAIESFTKPPQDSTRSCQVSSRCQI